MKPERFRSPFTLGVAGTALSGLVALLVWLDNKVGFRDAEAMATLLAALFSMITTIWLIVTVLLQRAELDLQREELALQRQESRRIADETAQQARLMSMQLEIAMKENLTAEVSAYIKLELADFCAIRKALRARIAEIASERLETSLAPQDLLHMFGHSIVKVRVRNSDKQMKVRYDELLDVLPGNYRLERMHYMAKRAMQVDLGDWFRIQMPFLIGDIAIGERKLSNLDVRLICNVASRMAFS